MWKQAPSSSEVTAPARSSGGDRLDYFAVQLRIASDVIRGTHGLAASSLMKLQSLLLQSQVGLTQAPNAANDSIAEVGS